MKKYIFVIFSFSFLFVTSLSFAQWENPPIALPASDGASSDEYGFSVDLSEDVGIVGAPYHDHLGSNSGAAYVWRKTGDQWVFEQELLASDGAPNDELGREVGMSGNFAVIGAPNHGDKGATYVYRYNGTIWVQDQKLFPPDLNSGDFFGGDVAISGNVILASAPYQNNYAGAVYVYRHNGANWIQEQKITPPPSAGNGFGTSVAVWSDIAVIGNLSNPVNGAASGAAYVYHYNGATWVEEQMIFPPDGATNDQFSKSLDVSNDVIVAGAHGDDDNGATSGSTYVFRFDGQSWNYEAKLLASDGVAADQFGKSVSVSGNLIAVGTPNRPTWEPHWHPHRGAAYVFRFNNGAWLEEAILLDPEGWGWDELGNAVSVSNNAVLIGSHQKGAAGWNSGSAFIFEGEPITTECTGDIDENNIVDIQDFLALLAAWGPNPGHAADFNNDGVVDIQDFLDLLAAWGPCP